MKLSEKLGRAGLYLIGAAFLYGMAYIPLKEHADISIIPDNWIEKFPVHGDIYRNTSGVHVDTTNTRSSSDSLENTILPAKAKVDGTKVIQ